MKKNFKDIHFFLSNLNKEFSKINFTKIEKKYFYNYYYDAGLFSKEKISFFHQHFTKNLKAIHSKHLANSRKILDLGCGIGSFSIYLDLCNKKVIAIDADKNSIKILKKRKIFYEKLFKKKLKIKIINKKADIIGLNKLKVDTIYSMFAFNLMHPCFKLLMQINKNPFIKKIIIFDGNPSYLFSKYLFNKKKISPYKIVKYLRSNGFKIQEFKGAVSIPSICWRFNFIQIFLIFLNNFFSKYIFINASYLLSMSRKKLKKN